MLSWTSEQEVGQAAWGAGAALVGLGKKCKASQKREILDLGAWATEREAEKDSDFPPGFLLTSCVALGR